MAVKKYKISYKFSVITDEGNKSESTGVIWVEAESEDDAIRIVESLTSFDRIEYPAELPLWDDTSDEHEL